jgi:PPM family protein phosphatase
MLIRWGALSDTGILRVQNEDSMLVQEGLFVVADGMGGHNAGEVASAMATGMLKSAHANGIADAKELGDLIKEINVQIFQSAAAKTEQSGMGTTLTALAITPSDQTLGENSVATATVANIGDSRTYLLRNGEFRQVSVDHSYVQELVSDGLITREEARTHARRNIVTRALGIEPVVGVDTWTLPLIAGDRYVLCSDGLVDEVTDADITTCLKRITDPQKTANELVAMANTNGGRDNITVIVVDVLAESDKPETKLETKPETKPRVTKLPSAFIRKLIISAVVSIVAVVAIVFITSYIRSGYFVDYENNKPDARVLIYRGKTFLWINPTIEADSTLIRTDLSAALAKEVTNQPGFDSALDAQDYVNQIRNVVETVLLPITSTTKP